MKKILTLFTLLIFSSVMNGQTIKESFHPSEEYEIRTDTTLNGIKYHWTERTIPNSYVIQEYEAGGDSFKAYFRDIELIIGTENNSLTINKNHFKDSINFDYSSDFQLRLIDFEGFDMAKEELKFFITISKPDTDWAYPIYLYIDSKGQSRYEMRKFEDDY